MDCYVLGSITGYIPNLQVSVSRAEIDVYVPGVSGVIARLPEDTKEAIITEQGLLLYRRRNGPVITLIPDQQEKVALIVKRHDLARAGARLLKTEKAVAITPKSTATHIDVDDNVINRLLKSYGDRVQALEVRVSAMEREIAALKAKAHQRPPQRQQEAVVEWTEGLSLHDGLTAVSDNPFVRRS